jgi:citrate synthase
MATKDSLTVTDNRTGKSYELPIARGTVRAMDLRQIKVDDTDFGLMTYDPAFTNTASCSSGITYIDGDKGILRHRGYAIEDLANNASYMEVAYLLLNGELPNAKELASFNGRLRPHAAIHESMRSFFSAFLPDAHPMGILVSAMGALGTFHPDSKDIETPNVRRDHMERIIAKIPTIAAWSHRHSMGLPYVYPDESMSYAANFLHMLKSRPGAEYVPHPDVVQALDVLFILHADHEQNCSTNTMRGVGSSHADPYSAVAAASAALYGPLHGGANEAVLRMLREIGSVDRVAAFVQEAKGGTGARLMGFGHRVYKNYDPRAKVIKALADRVFQVVGTNPLLDVALELEKHALSDEYFAKRKLYPNVDFYSGLIYEALEIPVSMFTVLFAIPRASGWLAQWEELVRDPEQKIARPRQIYTGHDLRRFAPLASR